MHYDDIREEKESLGYGGSRNYINNRPRFKDWVESLQFHMKERVYNAPMGELSDLFEYLRLCDFRDVNDHALILSNYLKYDYDLDDKLTSVHNKMNDELNKSGHYDPVDVPRHYNDMIISLDGEEYEIEARDIIDTIVNHAQLTPAQTYKLANTLKYLIRFNHKNGREDLKKAQAYLNMLIEEY